MVLFCILKKYYNESHSVMESTSNIPFLVMVHDRYSKIQIVANVGFNFFNPFIPEVLNSGEDETSVVSKC